MFSKLRHFLSLFLGEFSWQPPLWLLGGGRLLRDWARAHRRASAIIVTLVAILSVGTWKIRDWYLHRPQPETVSVKVIAPGLPQLVKDAKPEPLIVRFDSSV